MTGLRISVPNAKNHTNSNGMSGRKKLRGFATPLLALGIAAEILFCFKKDCSGKPDPKGNALIFLCKNPKKRS